MPFEIREFQGVAEAMVANAALARAHHDELAAAFHGFPFDPDLERYQRLEQAGLLVLIGAFDDGQLVGYSINSVSPNLDYQTVLCSHCHLLYLAPPYREGRNGLALMDATRAALMARGAKFVMWYAKPDTSLDKLLAHRAVNLHEKMYSEVLQ